MKEKLATLSGISLKQMRIEAMREENESHAKAQRRERN
jgi:hypothetical protein